MSTHVTETIRKAITTWDSAITADDSEKAWTLAALDCVSSAESRPLSNAEKTLVLQVLVNAEAAAKHRIAWFTSFLCDDQPIGRPASPYGYGAEEKTLTPVEQLQSDRKLYASAIEALAFQPLAPVRQLRVAPDAPDC